MNMNNGFNNINFMMENLNLNNKNQLVLGQTMVAAFVILKITSQNHFQKKYQK